MFTLEHATKAQRERESRGITLLFFNLGARWGRWSTSRPGRFTPQKDPVSIVQEAGWAPGSVQKISPLPGFDPRTVQPVASRYTDGAIPAHSSLKSVNKFIFAVQTLRVQRGVGQGLDCVIVRNATIFVFTIFTLIRRTSGRGSGKLLRKSVLFRKSGINGAGKNHFRK